MRSSENFENVTDEVSTSRADVSTKPAAATKTRSQSQRQKRVDSHDSSAITPQDLTITAKDARDCDSHKAEHQSATIPDHVDIPRGLSLRKKETAITPSPSSPPEAESPQPPPPQSPARKLGAFFRAPSSSPSEQSPIAAPKPLIRAATNPNSQIEDVIPPRGATMKERLAFARTRPPSPPLDAESMMVAVRPPMFDPQKGYCHQWISDLPSTSRPDRAWEWPKRWTCCRCDATTIVEQRVCASLECGHYRCPNDCRMIRVARPLGQFVGFGGS